LLEYRDKNHKTYLHWKASDFDSNQKPNWSHVYTDLAQLTARHTMKINQKSYDIEFAVEFLEIYFPGITKKLSDYDKTQRLVGFGEEADGYEIAKTKLEWISNLIKVGWHLCSNI